MGSKLSYMKFPEGRGKALTFSYDDGVVQDKRLIEIFDKYGLKAVGGMMGNMVTITIPEKKR